MSDTPDRIRQISWRELFPWLILLRTFRIAISPTLLAISTLAVLITPLGWRLGALLFHPTRIRAAPASLSVWDQAVEDLGKMRRDPMRALGRQGHDIPPAEPAPLVVPPDDPEPSTPWQDRVPRAENSLLADQTPFAALDYLPTAATSTGVVESYLDFTEPLARFFRLYAAADHEGTRRAARESRPRTMTFRDAAYYLFGTLWLLAVWSLPGGFITRRAIVELASESPTGLRETAEFTGSRAMAYFLAPLYPLLGVAAVALPIAIVGLFVGMSLSAGSIVAGVLWILVAAASLVAVWLLMGLMFGWPLMWPAISAERDGDAFEAFQRSYSYVYGKPLHYFFYFVVAAAFGALCVAAVDIAVAIVREFGFWALSWGGGGERVSELRRMAIDYAITGRTTSDSGGAGAALIGLVIAVIHAAAKAFRYTYFFTAAAAIYLLLRYDVDEKEMDEIWVGPRVDAPATRPVSTEQPPAAPPSSGAASAPPPAAGEP